MKPSSAATALVLSSFLTNAAHAQNLLVNGGFEAPVIPSGFTMLDNDDVPGWDAYEGVVCGGLETRIELWRDMPIDPQEGAQNLEITASSPQATVCQTYGGLMAGCPAMLCFYYTGRPGGQNNLPFDNDFTLTLSGGASYSAMLTHAAYVAPPSNGWAQFCLTFVPGASPLTIAFSRDPETGDEGGAHLDNVELTQPMACVDVCGNSNVDAGELCDDGDTEEGDGCDTNCTPSGCGNGIAGGDEECDDGNFVDGDGCDTSCLPTGCGSEVVVAPETCDPPGSPAGPGALPCRADCTVCGDEVLQTIDGEQCDDGNSLALDGCDPACLLECGNGAMEPGEICDDGNFVDGDGCDTNCTPTACGNGIETAGEECDDANLVSDDGCNGLCELEPCGPAPDPLCKLPALSLKSTLKLKDHATDETKDSMKWKWKNGVLTEKDEFGDPVAAVDYWFCLYDQEALVSTTRIPFGGICDDKPCWKETSKGFNFKNKDASGDGATKVGLTEGAQGKAKASFQAKGVSADVPLLLPLAGPIVAQLVRADDGACWSASFGSPFDKDDGVKLNDKAD